MLPGGRGDGLPITTLIDLESGSQIAHYHAGAADAVLLLANSGGFGLLAKAGDLQGRNRGGKSFLSLGDGDRLLPPVAVQPAQHQVACLALDGRLLVFALSELKLLSKGGKGLILMDVDAKTPLVSVAVCADSLQVQGMGRGDKPKEELLRASGLASHQGRRARKGHKIEGFKRVLRVK